MIEDCDCCDGSGYDDSCQECEGRGWVDDESDGGTITCPNCDGDNICWYCDGTGISETDDVEWKVGDFDWQSAEERKSLTRSQMQIKQR